jgi:hypothetical protein
MHFQSKPPDLTWAFEFPVVDGYPAEAAIICQGVI